MGGQQSLSKEGQRGQPKSWRTSRYFFQGNKGGGDRLICWDEDMPPGRTSHLRPKPGHTALLHACMGSSLESCHAGSHLMFHRSW